jgi:hypothetical protein
MSKLYFHNPGEIDIRGAFIAGLSAKESNTPIGEFGTGLKYAIACVLRWGGSITVYSGMQGYTFSKSPINFRGGDFEQIIMRPEGSMAVQELGFTTEYGKKWQPWQVFRELYANALDEAGGVTTDPLYASSGQTLIEVTCDKLLVPFAERDTIILPASRVSDHSRPHIGQVFDTPGEFCYFRGVRVYARPTMLTYNISDGIELTEDRTAKHPFQFEDRIRQLIISLKDESLIFKALNPTKDTIEADIEYPSWVEGDCSAVFLETAARLYSRDPSRHKRLKSLIAAYRPELTRPASITLSPMRQKMLDRAIRCCEQLGYHPAQFSIIVADLGASTLGKADRSTGEVFLSPLVFEQGTKQVLSTLLEELVHHEDSLDDCNYEMQTFLFNRWVSMFEEHVLGEPI